MCARVDTGKPNQDEGKGNIILLYIESNNTNLSLRRPSIMEPVKYGKYCSAINCQNFRGKNAAIVFFIFPKDEERYVSILSFLFHKYDM